MLRALDYPRQQTDKPIGFSEEDWSDMASWKGHSYYGPIDGAIHAVSKTLGYRNPEYETSDDWGTATDDPDAIVATVVRQ